MTLNIFLSFYFSQVGAHFWRAPASVCCLLRYHWPVPINILIFFLNNTKKCKIQKSKYTDTADWNKCWIFISFFHRRSVYANLLIKTFFYRYESSQKTLLSLKQELKTLTEMHEILQKHNESLKQQHDL